MMGVDMRLAFGQLQAGVRGGVNTAEAPFIRELEQLPGITVKTFRYGRDGERTSDIARVFSLLLDLALFAGFLRRYRPNIVHLNSAFDRKAIVRDVGYVIVARLFGSRIFLKYHGSEGSLLLSAKFPWTSLGRFCVRGVAGVGVLSSEEKRNFETAGHPSARIFRVKNAVDCPAFRGGGQRQRGGIQLLFISRFIPTKGLVESIEAMSHIIPSRPDVKLVCVGDGPDRPIAEALVHRLGLESAVRFTGQIPEREARGYYATSSILIFPTYHDEGFPMVVFQSLAAGLPIITTRIRAAADYLEQPANCIWVSPRDPRALAEKVLYMLENPALMQDMSTNNSALAELFSPPIVAQEYLDIYRRICS